MLLNGGRLGNAQILSPATVARMTTPSTPAGMTSVRGLGWDIDTTYSSNRGELFPVGSYGHTGFTGTSLWVDPSSQAYVIFLSNRLHPDGKGDVTPLRGRVATIAAAALSQGARGATGAIGATGSTGVSVRETAAPNAPTAPHAPIAPASPVLSGIDVLARDGFALLKG